MQFVILLTCIELKAVLTDVIAVLIISEKSAIPGLLKLTVR